MKSLGKRLPIFAALALGWIIGGFSGSSPTAVAQVARVTLESLQTQINKIINGTTTVAKATNADDSAHATTADSAVSVPWAGVSGVPGSIQSGISGGDGVSVDGGRISVVAGVGLTATPAIPGIGGAQLAISESYLQSNYLRSQNGYGLFPSAATRPISPDPGAVFWNTTTAKLEVWTGSAWQPLNLFAVLFNAAYYISVLQASE